jgi:hypothetical protein
MTDLRDTKRKKVARSPEDIFEIGIQEAQNAGVFRKRTQSAIKWYLGLIRRLAPSPINRAAFTKKERLRQGIRFGSLYCYVYDAKTKDNLPYWDMFPLVFPIMPTEKGNGWYGLNLHYVPLEYRAKLLSVLFKVANNKRYDETTKLRLSYEYIKNLGSMNKALAMTAFKQYLTSHVRSRFVYISPDEWAIALFLPMEQWQKKTFGEVNFDIQGQIKRLKDK